MFGQLNTSKFPALRSYADCEAYYNATAPIRGYSKDAAGVPLRRDRKNHTVMALLKSGDRYICRLYRTGVVTFHASGTIVADLTYGSLSTRDFANCFLPYGVRCTSDAGHELITDADGTYPAGIRPIELRPNKPDHDGAYRVSRDTVPLMGVQRVDRKKTAAPRAAIQPLLDYAKAFAAMIEADGMSREAHAKMEPYTAHAYMTHAYMTPAYIQGEDTLDTLTTIDTITDPDNWPSIIANSMQSGWEYRFGETRYRLNYEKFAKRVRETAYTLTGAHYIEPIPVGTVHKHMEPINK
jgi:hypothetical protein